MAENIGELYIQLKIKTDALQKDYDELKDKLKASASDIENTFKNTKLAFDNSLANKSISEIKTLHAELKKQLTDKINFDESVTNITEVKAKLASVEGILQDINSDVKKTPLEMSAWSNVVTGINQGFQLSKEIINSVTESIKESVTKAAEVESLRNNFKGTQTDIENMIQATGGTMDDGELIKLANKAIELNIKLKDIPIFMLIAKRAGDEMGADVAAGFDKIISVSEGAKKSITALLIERQRYNQIEKELASEKGGKISDLDSDTAKNVRLDAIKKASGITMKDVAERTKTSADEIKNLSVRIEEAQEKIGGIINKALIPLLRTLNDTGTGTEFFVNALIVESQTIGSLLPLLLQLKQIKTLLAIQTTITAEAEATAATETVAANTAISASIPMIGLAIVGLTALTAVIYKLANAESDELAEKAKTADINYKIAESNTETVKTNIKNAELINKTCNEAEKYINIISKSKNGTKEHKEATEKYNDAISYLNKNFKDIVISTDNFKSAQASINSIRQANINKEKEYNTELEKTLKLQREASNNKFWTNYNKDIEDKLPGTFNISKYVKMPYKGNYNTDVESLVKDALYNGNVSDRLSKIDSVSKAIQEAQKTYKIGNLSNYLEILNDAKLKLSTKNLNDINGNIPNDVKVDNKPEITNTEKEDKNRIAVERINNDVAKKNSDYELAQLKSQSEILESVKLKNIKDGLIKQQALYQTASNDYKDYASKIELNANEIAKAELKEKTKANEDKRKLDIDEIDYNEKGQLALLNYIGASDNEKLQLHKETLLKKLELSKKYYNDENDEIKNLNKQIKETDLQINNNKKYSNDNKLNYSLGISESDNNNIYKNKLTELQKDYENRKNNINNNIYADESEKQQENLSNDIKYYSEKKKAKEEYTAYLKEKYKNDINTMNELTPLIGASVENIAGIIDEQLFLKLNDGMNKTEKRMRQFANMIISELSRIAVKWATTQLISLFGNLLFPGAGSALGAVGATIGGMSGGGGGSLDKLVSNQTVNINPNTNIEILNSKLSDKIDNLINSVQAQTKTLAEKEMNVNINSNIDGMTFVKNVTMPNQNKLVRNGVNTNA